MNPLRLVARHSTVLFAGDAAARVLLFIATALIARRIGPDGFGLLAFAQALLGYLLLAGDFGLATLGTRELATASGGHGGRWLAVTRLRVGLTAALLVAALVAAAAWPAADATARAVVATTLLAALPAALLPDWAFRALGRMGAAAATIAAPPVLVVAGVLAFVHGPDDLVAVPAVRLAAAAIVALAGAWWLARGFPRGARAEARDWLARRGALAVLGTGATLVAANLSVLVYNSADTVILKLLTEDRVVGLYGSAYRVIQVPMAGFYAVTMAALPALARLVREDPAAAARLTSQLTRLAAAAGAAVALALWATRGPLVRAIYGPEYAAAADALAVLAFAVPLDLLASVRGTSYIAAGRERATLACLAVAAVANVAANVALVPRFGMMGAAWTTIATYAVLLAAYHVWMDRRR